MECKFCKSMFSNKSALNNHMKTAKYCLDIQNVKPLENKCKGCGKNFLKKFNYDRHIQSCIKIKFSEEFSEERQELKEEINRLLTINSMHESTIKNLHDQIKELQDKLENVAIKAAERPTIQNNNRISQIINNLQPLKMEDFKHHTQYLTLDHIKDGASGYAKYALEYPLKDKVICVDYARRKVKYKDENGNLVNDPEMTKISQKFFTDIEESNNNLIKEYNKIILEKMISVNEGTEEISEEEAERCLQIGNQLMDEMMRVKNLKHGIDEIKNGKKPDLLHDFVKDVCSKTTC